MDPPKQPEKTNRIKPIQRKIPAELKSRINPLYYDAIIKDLGKFRGDMLNFGVSEVLDKYIQKAKYPKTHYSH